MPPRTQEEKERRKKLHEQRKEARKKAKEEAEEAVKLPAAGKEQHDNDNQKQSAAATNNTTSSTDNDTSTFLNLPEDSVRQILYFMASRELGNTSMTCVLINSMMREVRIPFLLSRLHRNQDDNQKKTPPATAHHLHVDMCRDEAEARTLIKLSFGGGNTRRLVTKKGKQATKQERGDADEFIAYARFVEEAVSNYSPVGVRSTKNSDMFPAIVNGRFASVSPEHSLCRVGGDGSKCGAGGSGVAAWGVGKRGQLGLGKREDERLPKMLLGGLGYGIRIVQVAAGGGLVRVAHSLLLTASGRVLSFGSGQYGALGHGYSAGKQLPDVMRPKYIEALSHVRVSCIAAGELHSACVTTDGDLYTWGDGFCGQLGHGDKRPRLEPKQVECGNLEDECVSTVTCGARHTLCVTEDGEVWSFGLGHFGVLGRSFTPFDYDADAAVIALGGDLDAPVAEGVAEPANQEAAVPPPEVADANQQGVNVDLAGVAAALDVPAEVPAAAAAMLAQGDGIDEQVRAHLDLLANMTLDDSSDQCIPKVIDSLQGVKIIHACAGHRHSLVLDAQGGLYSFGTGNTGALGHGDTQSQMYPMRIAEFADNNVQIMNMSAGVDMSMAVSTTGETYAWGKTDRGRIGLGMSSGNVLIPRKVRVPSSTGEPVKAVDVDCGYVHSIIVALNGTIHVCGGVGIDGEDDGQREEVVEEDKGRPFEVKDFNIWHRVPEPKEHVKVEKWKKYGKYELKGRSKMLGEASKWNA